MRNGIGDKQFTDSPMLDAALSYAARGWFIFPAHSSGEKKSHKSSKHTPSGLPWGMSVDEKEIRDDFKKFKGCNVSIVTGEVSGIFVVECDTKTGHDVDGASNLAELEKVNGELPPTLMSESPTGSKHRYFKHPGKKVWNSSNNIAPGVDCKGDGGMVIAPPSVMPARAATVATADKPAKPARPGGAYRWINEGHDIAVAPDWLLDIVCKPTPKKDKNGKAIKADANDDGEKKNGIISSANIPLHRKVAVAATGGATSTPQCCNTCRYGFLRCLMTRPRNGRTVSRSAAQTLGENFKSVSRRYRSAFVISVRNELIRQST
jgi:hypothetical protein